MAHQLALGPFFSAAIVRRRVLQRCSGHMADRDLCAVRHLQEGAARCSAIRPPIGAVDPVNQSMIDKNFGALQTAKCSSLTRIEWFLSASREKITQFQGKKGNF
jgi:hypothetical protein